MSSEVLAAADTTETGKYYGGTVTVSGRNLITSLIAGETIEFTRIMVGSGQIPEGVEPIDMTDLVNPIAEASSSVPAVENQVVSMLIEYRNDMNGGLTQGFYLREFGIYAKTENSEEILLYYATLGDSPQPVNAYKENRIDIRRYPVVIELFVDADIQVGYVPGAFVTSSEVQAMVDAMVKEAVSDISSTVEMEVIIPTEGWANWNDVPGIGEGEEDMDEAYGLQLDIPIGGMTDDMIPNLTIYPGYLDVAKSCEMSTASRTMTGALRLYAKSVPSGQIKASLAILCSATHSIDHATPSQPGSTYVLPTATATRLGGIKIGSGLKVESDGTTSVDWSDMDEEATDDVAEAVAGKIVPNDEDVDAMLDDTFQPATPDSGT